MVTRAPRKRRERVAAVGESGTSEKRSQEGRRHPDIVAEPEGRREPGRRGASAGARGAGGAAFAEAYPVLKWAGGKTQLLERYRPYIPDEFGTYHEPFAGGAALFFDLRRRGRLRAARLSDSNEDLVNLYVVLRDDVEALVEELSQPSYRYEERRYYEIRAWDWLRLSPVVRAARLIYLNRTGFNGLYRLNRRGEFNVPFGRYVNPKICDPAALRAASAALQGVTIGCRPFEVAAAAAAPGDLVYFDPPYHPIGGASRFAEYDRNGFGPGDQRRLADCFAALDARGVQVMLSNSGTPLVEELYARFERITMPARRSINSSASKRGPVSELLVLGRTLGRGHGPRSQAGTQPSAEPPRRRTRRRS